MKRENLDQIASLLHSMKDHAEALEKAKKEGEVEMFNSIKRKILELKREVDKLL